MFNGSYRKLIFTYMEEYQDMEKSNVDSRKLRHFFIGFFSDESNAAFLYIYI